MTSWAIRMPRVIATAFAAEIHQQHLQFTAVIGIDGAGRVEHGEAVFYGEAGARPHLRLSAGRQRDGDTGGNERARAGRKRERLIGRHRGDQIEAGGERALVGRQRQVFAVREAQ